VPADFTASIGVNYCYKYTTRAVSNLCLRKNVVSRADEAESCEIVGDKKVSSSSAPVQVTSLSERSSGENQVAVTFTIENTNKDGKVFNVGSFSGGKACLNSEERDNEDYVYVKVKSNENVNIDCGKLGGDAEGKVRLTEDKTSIRCRIDTKNLQETAYTSPLDIEVDYVYKDFISKEITVENAL